VKGEKPKRQFFEKFPQPSALRSLSLTTVCYTYFVARSRAGGGGSASFACGGGDVSPCNSKYDTDALSTYAELMQ